MRRVLTGFVVVLLLISLSSVVYFMLKLREMEKVIDWDIFVKQDVRNSFNVDRKDVILRLSDDVRSLEGKEIIIYAYYYSGEFLRRKTLVSAYISKLNDFRRGSICTTIMEVIPSKKENEFLLLKKDALVKVKGIFRLNKNKNSEFLFILDNAVVLEEITEDNDANGSD